MESEDKSATTAIVKTETAAAGDLVLVARAAQETGEPPGVRPGEPPGGAGSLQSVALESEDKSATTAILKAETAAAGVLVLGAGVAQETGKSPGEPTGGARALAFVEFESEEAFKADTDIPTLMGRSSWSPRTSW